MKTDLKITPGDWTYGHDLHDGMPLVWIERSEGMGLRLGFPPDMPPDVAHDESMLITAAPAMLRLLETLHDDLHRRAAIASKSDAVWLRRHADRIRTVLCPIARDEVLYTTHALGRPHERFPIEDGVQCYVCAHEFDGAGDGVRIHAVKGGEFALRTDERELYELEGPHVGDCGTWAVCSTCAEAIPPEYLIANEARRP